MQVAENKLSEIQYALEVRMEDKIFRKFISKAIVAESESLSLLFL